MIRKNMIKNIIRKNIIRKYTIKNMKIRSGKIMTSLLIGIMLLSTVGCQKKAEKIEGFDESASDNESKAEISSESGGSKVVEYENWSDSLSGTGFESVEVETAMRTDYDLDNLSTLTVRFQEFNKDYTREMIETVFDSDDVEVYDFNKPTKRVYDDLLTVYNEVASMYDLMEKKNPNSLKYAPDEYMTNTGYWALTEVTEPNLVKREDIEEEINKLESEKESAPESIENDYSYQGYIGQIGGEDYYMYFGNREYDEYMNSPETTQFNGRVITIMRKSLEEAFNGSDDHIFLEENAYSESGVDEAFDSGVVSKMDAIVEMETSLIKDVDNPDEMNNYREEAENFLSKLGYSEYKLTGESNVNWGNQVSNGFLYKRNIPMSVYSIMQSDGVRLRYSLEIDGTDKLLYNDVQLPSYAESDTLDIKSYVDVMVNDKGILCCQIFNPAKVIKEDSVERVLDNSSVIDIVKDSVNDKSVWNIPAGREVKNTKITNEKLVSFPVRSKEDASEYTFVPCYMFYSQLDEDSWYGGSIIPAASYTDYPFILINAIDGSFVKVEDELTDYPSGWDNGNVGYTSYKLGTWTRFIKED